MMRSDINTLRTDPENSRVFCSRELVANYENSHSILFNNYGEHDKILNIFTDNFSDVSYYKWKWKKWGGWQR